jgi:lipid A disaccharide synthetase
MMVNAKFIGMVNILSSKKIVEELIQEKATAENIAQNTLAIITNKEKYESMKNELSKIKELLSPYAATDKFADFIGRYLSLTHR